MGQCVMFVHSAFKTSSPEFARIDASVGEAAELLAEKHTKMIVVFDPTDRVVGVLTDDDIMRGPPLAARRRS